MTIALLAVLFSVLQASIPIPGQATNHPAQRSDNANQQPNTNNSPTIKTVPTINNNPPAGNENKGQTVAYGNAEQTAGISKPPPVTVTSSKRDWADWGVWGFDFLLVVVGGLQVWLLCRTFGAINRQANQMEIQTRILGDSVQAAQKAADAALDNVQLVISTERAFIDVNLVTATTYIDEQTGEEYLGRRDEDIFRYGIAARNHGRTVARIISYEILRDCSVYEAFKLDKLKKWFIGTDQILLGANESHVLGHIDVIGVFTDEEWPSVQDGTRRAIFRIDVLYEDLLKKGPEGRHKTSAVYRWDPRKEEPIRLSEYNSYT